MTTEWAVRAEMVRDDVEDIQEYMQRLVSGPTSDGPWWPAATAPLIASAIGPSAASRWPGWCRSCRSSRRESRRWRALARAGSWWCLSWGSSSRLGTLVLEIEQAVLRVEETRTAP